MENVGSLAVTRRGADRDGGLRHGLQTACQGS